MQMARGFVQSALGDVRGLHEAVVMLAMHLTRVVFHGVDDRSALRMEHGQTGADLVREGEQVHLGAKLTVIALGGLLKTGLVCLEVFLGGEGRAIDALQHGVGFAATPVRGGGTFDLERLDVAGVRQMRATAQILPDHIAVAVDIVVEAQFLLTDLGCGSRIQMRFLVLDELDLIRLIGFLGQRLLLSHHATAEGLRGLDDALHALFDVLQILRREGLLNIEIVIEAVLDHGTYAKLGIGIDLLHGLGHDMGCRVTHDRDAVFGIKGDAFNGVAVGKRRIQIARFAIQTHCDDVLVIGEQFDAGGGCFHLLRFAVDCDGDGALRHDVSFAIGARGTNVQAWTGYQQQPR